MKMISASIAVQWQSHTRARVRNRTSQAPRTAIYRETSKVSSCRVGVSSALNTCRLSDVSHCSTRGSSGARYWLCGVGPNTLWSRSSAFPSLTSSRTAALVNRPSSQMRGFAALVSSLNLESVIYWFASISRKLNHTNVGDVYSSAGHNINLS